jgi:hypothetical protein
MRNSSFLVVIATIGGALLGAALGAAIGQFDGQSGARGFVGFVVGGGMGFLSAALASALMFALTEIAGNTRRTRELLERGGVSAALSASSSAPNTPLKPAVTVNEFRDWVTSNGQVVTRTAADYLARAKSAGYEVTQDDDKTIVATGPDNQRLVFHTNADILVFGGTVSRPPT